MGWGSNKRNVRYPCPPTMFRNVRSLVPSVFFLLHPVQELFRVDFKSCSRVLVGRNFLLPCGMWYFLASSTALGEPSSCGGEQMESNCFRWGIMTHARNRMLFRFVGLVVLVYDICDRLFGLSNFCTVCSGIYGWNYLEKNVDFFTVVRGLITSSKLLVLCCICRFENVESSLYYDVRYLRIELLY